MANTFRKIYKKTGNSGSSSDYQLVGNVGVNGVELDIMKGASSSTDGELGLVPKPSAGSSERYLSANGTFKEISGYSDLQTKVSELDKKRLHWTTLNTPSVTVPSKGFAELILEVPALVGYYLIGVNIIGATRIDDIAQVVVCGASRVFDGETLLYVKLFNFHTQNLTDVFQLSIWFADQ